MPHRESSRSFHVTNSFHKADPSHDWKCFEYLNSQNGESLDKNEILVYVNDKYFYEYDAVQKRLDEQVNAGNIIKSGDKYKISNRGAFILNLFGFITNIYGIENNFISNN